MFKLVLAAMLLLPGCQAKNETWEAAAYVDGDRFKPITIGASGSFSECHAMQRGFEAGMKEAGFDVRRLSFDCGLNCAPDGWSSNSERCQSLVK